ncbi:MULTISPECIES: sel1 repeat family protein [unclassified Xanthomonas]|uniref:sel1 repeat family protein n=1 Tax=unclassified Xanthomonas TaxID=2643310 RepID=UPI00163A992A|nr:MULTISPECIES: sel1 repeat family protein [unclassified Xanthomonas]QNH14861.1 sel1 repeat family protein [Xanthomonas sp. SI]QNH19090.1 sel1 repeat family protein [Xanthomonas sp. SS]
MHQFKGYAIGGCAALVVAVALALSGPAAAADNARTFDDIPAQVMTDGFLEAHLDLFYRRAGIRADKKGEFAEAKKNYQLAARYADKPSQARLGEMYWEGQGGAQDRAMGFLWMALASERGYDAFTTRKMEYWNQLTPEERQRAVKQDKKMLATYGDQVAKPRQEAVLRREASRSTGSMLGYSGASGLQINGPRGGSVDPEVFYAKEFWEPAAYWKLQDRVWDGRTPGRVDIGDVEDITQETAPKPPQPAKP